MVLTEEIESRLEGHLAGSQMVEHLTLALRVVDLSPTLSMEPT